MTRAPAPTFYGGYAGVFLDPDGHAWEIAFNPGFTLDDDGAGFAADAQGPVYDVARSAFRDAWAWVEAVDIGVGGSIPFVAAFAERFPDAAILVTGVEDPDTRAHGIDEGLHLAEFERVCLAETRLLDLLAVDHPAAAAPAD